VLSVYSATLLLVMASSYIYSLDTVLRDAHFVFGTVLIVLVATASLWMFLLWPPSTLDALSLFIQLSGGALALLAALGLVHFLFLAEIMSNVGFTSLVFRTCRKFPGEGYRDPVYVIG
jgi:hypothetical protein